MGYGSETNSRGNRTLVELVRISSLIVLLSLGVVHSGKGSVMTKTGIHTEDKRLTINKVPILNRKFANLTVLGVNEVATKKRRDGRIMVRCRCKCGKEVTINKFHLAYRTRGDSKEKGTWTQFSCCYKVNKPVHKSNLVRLMT